ncbi:MAG TPA: sterol desaturase family protein, partial [Gemmatimonadales bacterium]
AQDVYRSPWFYVLIAAILLLEFVRPAIRGQRIFSRALVQDFLWFNVDMMFKVAALPVFVGVLQIGYNHVTGGFTLPLMRGWPLGARVAASFIAFDFLQWFHHWVQHRVTAFWHFHAIHHSQHEMNLFTDLRVHWVDHIVAQLLIFVPMFMFALKPFAIVSVAVVMEWFTHFNHANVRTNLGPLRHLVVTPQFHRIHHSIERRHRDRNFGVCLTIWDRMFGTLYAGYDEYPATGVEGIFFAAPDRFSPAAWLADFWRQFIYPFKQLRANRPTAQ